MNLKDTTRVILKSLVTSSQEPLTIDQLEHDYKRQEGKPIPFAQLGYDSLRKYLLSIPDTLAYNSARRTFSAVRDESGKSDHIHKLVSEQRLAKNRPKNNLKPFNHSNHHNSNGRNREPQTQVWENHPLNYNANFGHPNYNGNNYGHPISYQPSYRVNSFRPFEPGNLMAPPSYSRDSLLGLPPMLNINVPSQITPAMNQTPARYYCSTGRQNNFNKSKPDTVQKNSTSSGNTSGNVEPTHNKTPNHDTDTLDGKTDLNSEETGALPPIDDDDPIKFIGSKMMSSKYGRTIPLATIPKTLESGHTQQIYVTEVTKFPYFYFQFAGTDDTNRGLQEELDLTYNDDNAVERIEQLRPTEIQIGNVCAAYYANKWSRAEILSNLGSRLKVQFVDYGTTHFVSIKKTRYLGAELCEIPRLCHLGSLAFIEPLMNDQLEKEIISKFCEMVANRSLIAVFSNVDESDDISMTLVDTSDAKVDLIVNKILMEAICDHKSDEELDVRKRTST